MHIAGAAAEGDIRVIEWPENRFFIGTLFVSHTKSTQEQPHLLVSALLCEVTNGD